jgi:hypothetical protein
VFNGVYIPDLRIENILLRLSETSQDSWTTVQQLGAKLGIGNQDDNDWGILCSKVYSLYIDQRIQIPIADNHLVNVQPENNVVPFLSLRLLISSKGIEFLNQIEMRKAIEKFNKSSGRLTLILIVLTVVVAIFAILTYIRF